jgi:hypothetical protein
MQSVTDGLIQNGRDCKGASWKQVEVGNMWSETCTSYRNWRRYCGTGSSTRAEILTWSFVHTSHSSLTLQGCPETELLKLDLAPSDCQVLDPLQNALRGRYCTSDQRVTEEAVHAWLVSQNNFSIWTVCVENKDDVEKYTDFSNVLLF